MTDLIDLVACEGSVGGHEEVAPWGWDERGDDADKVVIHISGVSESLRAGCHDGRDLQRCQL